MAFLSSCAAYQRSKERYYIAITKRQFAQFSSDKCDFDFTTPKLSTGNRPKFNIIERAIIYKDSQAKVLVHELTHAYVVNASHECLSEMVATLMLENYELQRKYRFLQLETTGFKPAGK